VNVFGEFLPPRLDGREARLVVLDHTRHTPRDLVQVMRSIQQVAGSTEGRLSVDQVKDGLRAYSVEYLIPELRNELAGYLEPPEIDQAIMLLTALRRQRFRMEDLVAKAGELNMEAIDLAALVRALFSCSCMGTVEGEPGEPPLFTFKYRNPNAVADPGQEFYLHPGTLKGLNIERRRPSRRNRRR
ncbi:MAG: P-loop ATPase, Sll1717 family, partial [Solirubrobacteraceae bacterium]